jgi:hypothetical protein
VLGFEIFIGVESFFLNRFLNILEYLFLANDPCLAHGLVYGVLTDKKLQRKF